ncbi:MAG: YafY family transcriptional regulator [Oscillospiraceae bacterium]|nr:YafY family transcriptional regulator [Oscillospiraceae bacterium]
MQINRILEIVYILLNQKTTTAKQLAERFSVSQRTIYRDIDTLSIAGIPVYTEKGKGGGISLLPEFVLSKSILSDNEQNEILSALQGLTNMGTVDSDHALQKLSAVFSKSVTKWLEVDFSDWSYSNAKIFYDLKTAILEHRIIEFEYYSAAGEMTHRRIEPVQLWFKSKYWYIKGFCLKRQNVRLFKLTRIRELQLTNEKFEPRNLLEAPPEPESEKTESQVVEIILKINKKMAHRVLDEWSDRHATKLPDGNYKIIITMPEDEWLYRTILSYGEYIEVLHPPSLRENIKEKAKSIIKNNS